jgi:hypothetical protein
MAQKPVRNDCQQIMQNFSAELLELSSEAFQALFIEPML